MTEHYHLIDELGESEFLFPTQEEAYRRAMEIIDSHCSLVVNDEERIEWDSPFGRIIITRCARGTCIAAYEQLGDE